MRYSILLCLLLAGCNAPSGSQSAASYNGNATCRGIYYLTDSQGNLKKYNQYLLNGQCVTDNMSLSQWEASLQSRTKKNVTCTPQPQFQSRTLISANNFYAYRDGRIYLDLNGATGEYRRITLAEGKDGNQVFTRLLGCFYVRNDATFGQQLLLDSIDVASSQAFDPMEIFTYTTTTATTMEMVRFDDSSDWDFRNCVYLDTPWGYCDLLRNGNEMFFPVLNASQEASLLADAILIRRQFNYSTVSLSTFNNLWNNPTQGGKVEETREDYKYAVAAIVDTPRYIDQAWADFVRGNRPSMPDVTSNRIPEICWSASRTISYSDDTTGKIYGEACYVNGVYEWTAGN